MLEDLDLFLVDFGLPVVSGSLTGMGILDMPDQDIGGGISISSDTSVLLRASTFGGLKFQDPISVNGVAYKVKEFKLQGDGAFGRATLQKL